MKAYDTVKGGRIVQYFRRVWGTHEIVQADKMCSNETYSKFHIGTLLSDTLPVQNGLKSGRTLLLLFFSFALRCAIKTARWY
jgi:hypothetical protein